MDESRVQVAFDEFYQIRVFDPEKFKDTEKLQDEIKSFLGKTQTFNDTVQSLVTLIDEYAKRIETEKLKAIGQRNRAQSEAEARKRKKAELQALVSEKTLELERLTAQFESLTKVEQEQKLLIEKLGNNE
mmetsp:Transcript_5989/g.9199  ORF Transcript_5989/g.9199 Transcript_5989/m.9199 type:complete len:130 (+) Transcript_5989:78-467(+)